MEKINTLYAALNAFQRDFDGVSKNAANPFYKSRYADLHNVWEAVREPLTKNGLALIQTVKSVPIFQTVEQPSAQPGTNIKTTTEVRKDYVVSTRLIHTSGESIEFDFPILCVKPGDPQAFGSAVSYARRYAMSAVLGISQFDDDANKASDKAEARLTIKQSIANYKAAAKPPVKGEPEKVKASYEPGIGELKWKTSRSSVSTA